jgi:hypothetical protein
MQKIVLSLLFVVFNLYGDFISSDDNYQIYKTKYYNIIYTDDFKNEAKYIKINIDNFLKQNDKSFGYRFDEKITIVLVSNNIQIANAFSTQIPHNIGVYYSGGSSSLDYFSSVSWLKTLFVHEMIHNYQLNAKQSVISQTLHKFFGNNSFPIFASVVPLFTIVNNNLPSIFLEGNAVLNESLYGIGGRLYNGELMALKNSLILNDKITLSSFINNTTLFPYGTKRYIIGGFYMKYLLLKYGLQKVNNFFYANSIHSINPYLLDRTFKNHFNIGLKQSIYDFVNYTKHRYKDFNELKGTKKSISSQTNIKLNKIKDKIYFITSNLKNDKKLYLYDIKKDKFHSQQTTLQNGKVFKIDGKLYVNATAFIDSTLYKNALYDKNNKVLKNTTNKAIQDIYKNKIAYIKIDKSFLDNCI